MEAQGPFACLGFLDGDGLSDEGFADIDGAALPFDLAGGTDAADGGLGRIVGLRRDLGHRARAFDIAFGGHVHADGLVGTLVIVVGAEAIEARLLLGSCAGGRAGEGREGEIEPLLGAVLLGFARRDALKLDAELDEAHRQRAQAADPGAGERRAIVASNALGQPIFLEQRQKQRPSFRFAGRRAGLEAQKRPAMAIHDRQRLAARGVLQPEPTLVVRAPHRVRLQDRREGARPSTPPARPTPPHQAMPLEDLTGRRHRRPRHVRGASAQPSHDLLRSEPRPRPLLRQDRGHQVVRRRSPMLQRRVRPVSQPLRAFRLEALQPLVPGLARDAVPLTQRAHPIISRQALQNKTKPLIHEPSLPKSHRQVLPAEIRLLPIKPVRSVTLLSGSDNIGVPSPLAGEGVRRVKTSMSILY
jgi:hypothetical protein